MWLDCKNPSYSAMAKWFKQLGTKSELLHTHKFINFNK